MNAYIASLENFMQHPPQNKKKLRRKLFKKVNINY